MPLVAANVPLEYILGTFHEPVRSLGMQYLIQVPEFSHPYLTTLAFIAHDFRKWGHRVSVHADNSPYILEVRFQEQKRNLAASQPNLTEMWAKQLMAQPAGYSVIPTVLSQADTRLDRVSRMLEDFIRTIAAIGTDVLPTRVHFGSPKCLKLKNAPLPEEPGLNFVVLCIRMLHGVRHSQNATTVLVNQETVVDSIALCFRHNQSVEPRHVEHALTQMGSAPGRYLGRCGRDRTTGMVQVQMSVDVSDCIVVGDSEGEPVEEPLPLYTRGEHPPEYHWEDS